jgi:hypothetical protein
LARPRRRWSPAARRTTRRIALAVGALVLLVGLVAGVRLVQAARHLRAAQHLLTQAGEDVEAGRVADAVSQLDQATDRLSAASHALDGHLELDVFKPIPVLGDNLRALRRSVGLATQLSVGGSAVLRAAEPLQRPDGTLEVPLKDGNVPLATIQAVQLQAASLATALPTDDDLDGTGGLLLGPVKGLHDRVVREVHDRRDQLSTLAEGLGLLADMAGGSGTRAYLIVVANSAEMRGTGGMILSYGGLVGENGHFRLTEFGRIDQLALPAPLEPKDVPGLPADYLRRWDGFDPLFRWRNANLAADFPLVAPVLETMVQRVIGQPIDGVLQVDPIGLADLLQATGPVDVPELGSVSVENLVPLVLHDAYVRYKGIEKRSDVLKEVAEAAFDKIVTGDYDSLRGLGEALLRAAQGRHLMFHTVSPDAERHVTALGADGALPSLDGPDAVHLTVQNVSGNKLDYFVDTEVGLSGDVRPGRPGQVRAEVLVHNAAPADQSLPTYIFGPFNSDQEVGLYRGVVSLYLPRGATLLSASGDRPRDPPIELTEGGRPVVSWTVDLPAGATSHVVLELRLAPPPSGPYQLLAVPSPRVRPTLLRTDLLTGQGRLAERLKLDRTWRLIAGEAPRAVVGPVQPPLKPVGG